MKQAIKNLSYAVFPKRCGLCGDVIAFDEELCEECFKLERITGTLCNKCGKPKENCTCDRKTKAPEYKRFIAPYYYEGSVRAGANRFKDYGYPELAIKMGEELFRQIDEQYKGIAFDCITFVPMTKEKQKKRGYNQSELLAKEVAKHMNLPCMQLIAKIKTTPPQKTGSARKRRINLRGSFDLADGVWVENKTILLIDDIKTTGSTLNECAYVLNAYGAKAVYAAAFCLTENNRF